MTEKQAETLKKDASDPDTTTLSAYESIELGVGDCLKDRFILEEEIGRGGMGVVFKALDLRKKETGDREPYVAIKLISSKLKQLKDSMIALQREAKKSQKLAHPNVATVYDFDRDGDNAFLCMELLEGEPLSDFLERVKGEGLSFKQALPIMQGMARGLAYAHSENIVHSDFKPGNVFITRQGSVKILDFGIARAFTPGNQAQEMTVFDPGDWDAITPAYASLEMFKRQDPDPRDDIYALGCVCYQLLAGRHPYDKTPAIRIRDNGLHAPTVKGLPRGINQLLQRSVALQRDERLGSVPEFLDALVPRSQASRKRWYILAALCLVSLIGLGASYLVNQQRELQIATEQGNIWLSKVQGVDVATEARIARLIEVAEVHASIGRYIEPPTSNAAEAYVAALELQPGNPKALAGANAIADAVLEQAQIAERNGQPESAKALLSKALEVLKGHPELESLLDDLSD